MPRLLPTHLNETDGLENYDISKQPDHLFELGARKIRSRTAIVGFFQNELTIICYVENLIFALNYNLLSKDIFL